MSADKKNDKHPSNNPAPKRYVSVLTFTIATVIILIEDIINALIFEKAMQYDTLRIIQLAVTIAAINLTLSLLVTFAIRFISRRPVWLKLIIFCGLFMLLVIIVCLVINKELN